MITMCFFPTVSVVSLERSTYQVPESVGTVEVCVRVNSPSVNCPIRMPFSVSIFTRDGTAGRYSYVYYLNKVMAVHPHPEVSSGVLKAVLGVVYIQQLVTDTIE